MTSLPVHRTARKHLGAYYSPVALVEPMVHWAIRSTSAVVLDPSCGDGVFLEAAARRLVALGASHDSAAARLAGVDLNPSAIEVTAGAVKRVLSGRPCRLLGTDFFQVEPALPGPAFAAGVEAVIGNPPYIRYQGFRGQVRDQALDCAARVGVRLSRLTSSWAPFVAHATRFLKPGGRMALILPAELVHTGYAAPIREHLRRWFASVTVVSFRRPVFPGVQERVIVLLADGWGDTSIRRLALIEAGDGRDLESLDRLAQSAELFAPAAAPVKWVPGFTATPAAASLDRLAASGRWAPLGQVAKVGIGFVSGANDFFVLSAPEAARLGLPQRSLRPCVLRARQVAGAFFAADDFAALRRTEQPCLLWHPRSRLAATERAYVGKGERRGLHRRYKCRVRSPWYLVPGVVVPDAMFTYMSDSLPRLCLNEAGVAVSNNLLAVRFRNLPDHLKRAFVVAFYNSATLCSIERIGRSYGGGVLKLEPREAERALVPCLDLVSRNVLRLRSIETDLQTGLAAGRNGNATSVIAAIDRILLAGGMADGPVDARLLAEERELLAARRRAPADR